MNRLLAKDNKFFVDFINLKQQVFERYYKDDPSHDSLHVERVLYWCKKLEEGSRANLDLLLPAALMHDIVNVPKNSSQRTHASSMAADQSSELLRKNGYSQDEIQKIQSIIIEHSFSLGKKPSTVESSILQDADKLDALGAIGIMRTITCGTLMGSVYYNNKTNMLDPENLDDKKYMIDHFYEKLFKLPELMNTEIARQESLRRVEFMKIFLKQLFHESVQQ